MKDLEIEVDLPAGFWHRIQEGIMPGESREPKHMHIADRILFELEDGNHFYIAKCKVCGRYLIVNANRPGEQSVRVASHFEALLLRRIEFGPPIEVAEYLVEYFVPYNDSGNC